MKSKKKNTLERIAQRGKNKGGNGAMEDENKGNLRRGLRGGGGGGGRRNP